MLDTQSTPDSIVAQLDRWSVHAAALLRDPFSKLTRDRQKMLATASASAILLVLGALPADEHGAIKILWFNVDQNTSGVVTVGIVLFVVLLALLFGLSARRDLNISKYRHQRRWADAETLAANIQSTIAAQAVAEAKQLLATVIPQLAAYPTVAEQLKRLQTVLAGKVSTPKDLMALAEAMKTLIEQEGQEVWDGMQRAEAALLAFQHRASLDPAVEREDDAQFATLETAIREQHARMVEIIPRHSRYLETAEAIASLTDPFSRDVKRIIRFSAWTQWLEVIAPLVLGAIPVVLELLLLVKRFRTF